MSELDFLLNRKKKIDQREEKTVQTAEEKKEESINSTAEYIEKKEENKFQSNQDRLNSLETQREEKEEESREDTEEVRKEVLKVEKEESREDNVESIMKSFLDKDPKIGVWSYPAFLVLQYLYNTKPGFKMSKVAKEALEYGLKRMYPELFDKAEKISQIKYK